MKYLIFILTVTVSLNACNRKLWQQQIQLNNNIMTVIDSFTNKYDNYPYYELYIDKMSSYDVILIMNAGYRSLTEEENRDYNQSPLFYTVTSNNKKVVIFSGIERYVLHNKDYEYIERDKNKNSSVSWTIRDSMRVLTIDSIYGVYPFFPLPMKFDVPLLVEPRSVDDTQP